MGSNSVSAFPAVDQSTTRSIGDGFTIRYDRKEGTTIWDSNEKQIPFPEEIAALDRGEYDYNDDFAFVSFHTVTIHLPKDVKSHGRITVERNKPYSALKGQVDSRKPVLYYFIVDKTANKILGPFSEKDFYARPELQNIDAPEWKYIPLTREETKWNTFPASLNVPIFFVLRYLIPAIFVLLLSRLIIFFLYPYTKRK